MFFVGNGVGGDAGENVADRDVVRIMHRSAGIEESIIRRYYEEFMDYDFLGSFLGSVFGREFAVEKKNGVFVRNLFFDSYEGLREYLSRVAPLSVYVGARYDVDVLEKAVERRGYGTVNVDGGWESRELVFDFDANDYSDVRRCGCTGKSICDACNLNVFPSVVFTAELLMSKLGLERPALFFSGGRGYHLWFLDERTKKYDTGLRRGVVGLVSVYFRSLGSYEPRPFPVKSNNPNGGFLSWRKIAWETIYPAMLLLLSEGEKRGLFQEISAVKGERVASVFRSVVEEISVDSLYDHLSRMGVFAKSVVKDIGWGVEEAVSFSGNGSVDGSGVGMSDGSGVVEKFLGVMKKYGLESSANNKPPVTGLWRKLVLTAPRIDHVVTTDVKRIIRLPLSVHGKTGVIVSPVVSPPKSLEVLANNTVWSVVHG